MMTASVNQTYWRGLDLLKFILAFFIVATHCRLSEECPAVKGVLDVLFSMAVPLYFAISSYLFTRRLDSLDDDRKPDLLKHYLLRLAILFCTWYVLSLPATLNLWWKVATPKETVYALFLGCTARGYWFIKVLGINLTLLFLCRRKKLFVLLTIFSVLVFFVFAFNYVFHFFSYPYSPYYSFYYHLGFCCMGVWFARKPQMLHQLEQHSGYLAIGWLLLFTAAVVWMPLRPLFLLLSLILVFPCFSRESQGKDLRNLRHISTFVYMSQFLVIYYYDLLFEGTQSFLTLSPDRFSIVTVLCLTLASVCLALEHRFPVLKYLR